MIFMGLCFRMKFVIVFIMANWLTVLNFYIILECYVRYIRRRGNDKMVNDGLE